MTINPYLWKIAEMKGFVPEKPLSNPVKKLAPPKKPDAVPGSSKVQDAEPPKIHHENFS